MKTYSITDLSDFCKIMRTCAAESLAEQYSGKSKYFHNDDLDKICTLNQVKSFIEENNNGTDEKDRYIINDDLFVAIFDNVRNLIYQSAMSKLAAKGLVECAWDDEKEQMIFWVDNKENSDYNK